MTHKLTKEQAIEFLTNTAKNHYKLPEKLRDLTLHHFLECQRKAIDEGIQRGLFTWKDLLPELFEEGRQT